MLSLSNHAVSAVSALIVICLHSLKRLRDVQFFATHSQGLRKNNLDAVGVEAPAGQGARSAHTGSM